MCVYACVCVRVCVYVHACMSVCVHVCMCVLRYGRDDDSVDS